MRREAKWCTEGTKVWEGGRPSTVHPDLSPPTGLATAAASSQGGQDGPMLSASTKGFGQPVPWRQPDTGQIMTALLTISYLLLLLVFGLVIYSLGSTVPSSVTGLKHKYINT